MHQCFLCGQQCDEDDCSFVPVDSLGDLVYNTEADCVCMPICKVCNVMYEQKVLLKSKVLER